MTKKSRKILRYVLIMFGVLAIAAIGFRIYQIQAEKRNFAQAEKSIDSLAQQIEQTIGKPDETKKEKSCNYASRKFEKGPLSCTVSLYSSYKNQNNQEATTKMHAIFQLSKGTFLQRQGDRSVNGFISANNYPGKQLINQDYSAGNLDCGIQYSYPLSTESLKIEASCGAQTISELFQLKD